MSAPSERASAPPSPVVVHAPSWHLCPVGAMQGPERGGPDQAGDSPWAGRLSRARNSPAVLTELEHIGPQTTRGAGVVILWPASHHQPFTPKYPLMGCLNQKTLNVYLKANPICLSCILFFLYIVISSLSPVRLFCNAMDCSPPGSSVHGISRILGWVAISFSRGSL